MSTVDLPNIREPFLAANGQISRPWWIWLQQLMTRVGGSDGTDITALQTLVRQLIKDVIALEHAATDDPTGQRIATLDLLLEEISAMQAGANFGHGQWDDPDMHLVATATAAGFMSAADKAKLDTFGSAFSANQSGVGQAIAAATPTVVICNTETLDALGEYNPVTGIFTAQAAGQYVFSGRVHGTQTTATTRTLSLYVNGAEVSRMQQKQADNGNCVIAGDSGVVTLAASDQIAMRYFSALADTIVVGAALTNFSGWRIR